MVEKEDKINMKRVKLSNNEESNHNFSDKDDSNVLWIAFQLSDSSFGGSLSHSMGLESALLHGVVHKTTDSLHEYMMKLLEQAEEFTLPIILMAYQVTTLSEMDWYSRIVDIDNKTHAMLTSEVSRRVSLNQGRCFLRVIVEAFGDECPQLKHVADSVQKSLSSSTTTNITIETLSLPSLKGHYSVIFGLFCGCKNIPILMTIRVFLRILIRDTINSATRLSILGPLQGAKIQANLSSHLESIATRISNLSLRLYMTKESIEPIQSHPFLEMIQSRHDLLYTRLFNS